MCKSSVNFFLCRILSYYCGEDSFSRRNSYISSFRVAVRTVRRWITFQMCLNSRARPNLTSYSTISQAPVVNNIIEGVVANAWIGTSVHNGHIAVQYGLCLDCSVLDLITGFVPNTNRRTEFQRCGTTTIFHWECLLATITKVLVTWIVACNFGLLATEKNVLFIKKSQKRFIILIPWMTVLGYTQKHVGLK